MADNVPPSSADVTKSGSLNVPQPSGPHRPVMGFPFTFRDMKETRSHINTVLGTPNVWNAFNSTTNTPPPLHNSGK
jgi:hypothetical protein